MTRTAPPSPSCTALTPMPRRRRPTAPRPGCGAATRRRSGRTSCAARPCRYRRERVDTPDGDFWLFDWLDAPALPQAPLVVLFHGLEGGSGSHYVRALFVLLAALGWRGVVPHFRGCADEPNRLPRAYHSGDHEEIDAMLAAVRARIDPGDARVRLRRLAGRQRAAQLAGPAGRRRAAHRRRARPRSRHRST